MVVPAEPRSLHPNLHDLRGGLSEFHFCQNRIAEIATALEIVHIHEGLPQPLHQPVFDFPVADAGDHADDALLHRVEVEPERVRRATEASAE